MLESKDFRRGIHMLEWERKRLEMEIEDLTQKAQDIQMLRLTRELQNVLSSNVTPSNASQLSRIDKTLQSQNETFAKREERFKAEAVKVSFPYSCYPIIANRFWQCSPGKIGSYLIGNYRVTTVFTHFVTDLTAIKFDI